MFVCSYVGRMSNKYADDQRARPQVCKRARLKTRTSPLLCIPSTRNSHEKIRL